MELVVATIRIKWFSEQETNYDKKSRYGKPSLTETVDESKQVTTGAKIYIL